MMIVHLVLFKWQKNVSKEQITKLMTNIVDLKSLIPEVRELHFGENFSKWNEGYTHALVVILQDRKVLDIYRQHPAHAPIIQAVEKLEERSISIDFESQK